MTGDPAFDVIVCGSLHLDIIVHAPGLPAIDETVVGSRWRLGCGGKGRNQAQAAAAGARVAMIGRVGDDDFGRRLIASLRAAGVDHSEVAVDATRGSGMSVAIQTAEGEYGAVIVSGCNLASGAAAVAGAWARLGGARALVLQNELPEPVNLAAAMVARAGGAVVVLNAAPARPIPPELLDLADVLVVNRVEAAQLSGRRVHDAETARAALAALGAERRRIVVTLGAAGLVAGGPGMAPTAIAAEPVEVVSTHGAGDCFVGVLAARLATGVAFEAACHEASRAAARHVSRGAGG